MSKVKVQGHASGTGVLTVTAPNTSSDRTITLPDATGTLLNSDGDGSSLTGVGVGKNIAINGAMLVAQRGTSTTDELYGTVDRFNKQTGGTDEAVTQSQADVASGTTPYSQGFRKTFRLTNGNQTGGAGVTDYASIYYYLEGQDISRSGWDYTSASSYITLSYWVKASVAQTYYARFRAYSSSQYEYSWSMVLSADTWTKITVSIPGNSNLANLVSTNAIGAFIQWVPFYGTDYTDSGHTLNSWAVKDNNSAFPDYTSTWWTTDDSTFEITGVKLEVGSSATDFEHRSYGTELALCRRYYLKWAEGATDQIGVGFYETASQVTTIIHFPSQMRVAPSLDYVTGTSYYQLGSDVFDVLQIYSADQDQLQLYTGALVSGTQGDAGMLITGHASAYVAFDAEL